MLPQHLGEVVDEATLQDSILPLIRRFQGDKVPNVRLNMAKVLGALLPKFSAHARAEVWCCGDALQSAWLSIGSHYRLKVCCQSYHLTQTRMYTITLRKL